MGLPTLGIFIDEFSQLLFVIKLQQHISGQLQAIIFAAAHIANRRDFADRHIAGGGHCFFGKRLALQELLGFPQSQHRRADCAVSDCGTCNRFAIEPNSNRRGESGNIQIAPPRDFVQSQKFVRLRQRDA